MPEKKALTNEQIAYSQEALWTAFLESDQTHLTWMTELLDPILLSHAADVIISQLQKLDLLQSINKIAGVPTKGLHLQTAIGMKLGLPLIGAHKGGSSPKQWLRPLVLRDGMKQMRNGEMVTHVLGGIESGDNILLVDDVLAKGGVMLPVVDNFLRCGIKPVVATYGVMLFETGFKGLMERNMQPIYALGFENIMDDGRLILRK